MESYSSVLEGSRRIKPHSKMGCGSSVQSEPVVRHAGVEATKQQANDEDLAISTWAQTSTVLPPATPKRPTLFDFLFAKTPPAGAPPAKSNAPGDWYDPKNANRCYVPLLLDHQGLPQWLDSETSGQGEFALCFLENVLVSYRLEEQKTRSFAVTSLGRIAIIKDGKLPGGHWPASGAYSACDHAASLRELKLEGKNVTMELRGRAFVLKCKTAVEASKAVSALVTVSLMLFSGPPPFKLTDVDLKANQIVTPSAAFIIGCNLPPGWEQAFTYDGKPYYINILEQTTTWTTPAMLESCNVSRLSKYPRCLPDNGLWASLRLWCFYFSHHGIQVKHAGGTPRQVQHGFGISHPTVQILIKAPPPQSGPYWCADGATNGFNGRPSTIIDLTILAAKVLPQPDLFLENVGSVSGAFLEGWVSTSFLPALKQALSANKFFTGITLSTPDRASSSNAWFCRGIAADAAAAGVIQLVQVSAGMHSELGFPLPCPQPPSVAARTQAFTRRALGVQVWSGRHLPRKDWLGKIDAYVKLYLISGPTPDLCVHYRKYVEKEDGVKTACINSNYNPDWHHKADIGAVPWTRFEVKRGRELNTLRLLGIVKDHDTIKTDDIVGIVEIHAPPMGGEAEGFYAVKDAQGRTVEGHDGREAHMYLRLRWLDADSAMQGIEVPGTPAGKLTSIDLSWRDDLAPNVVKYCLHHAGTLKTLRVAGISAHAEHQLMSLVAEGTIIEPSLRHIRALLEP